MKEGEFGKIRDVARFLINNPDNAGKNATEKKKTAFGFLKHMKEEDPANFSTYIDDISSRIKLLNETAKEAFKCYLLVNEEKDWEYWTRLALPSTVPESTISLDEKEKFLQKISDFLRLTEKSIRTDPRIQEAFNKNPGLLDDLLKNRAITINNFYKNSLRLH